VLGHNERLEKKLREHGKRAWATVLESEKGWASTGGLNKTAGQAGSMTIHQKLTLRVEPDGEQPFEAKIKQVFNDSEGMSIPQEGYSVAVFYDGDDHSKVALDMEGTPVRPGRDREAAAARREQVLDQYEALKERPSGEG
jgi:hypothetical protein